MSTNALEMQLGEVRDRPASAGYGALEIALRRSFYAAVGSAGLLLILMVNGERLLGKNLLLVGLMYLAILVAFDTPKMIGEDRAMPALTRILQRWCLVWIGVGGLVYFSRLHTEYQVQVLAQGSVALPLLMWLAHMGLRRGMYRLRAQATGTRVLIVGVTEVGRTLEERLRSAGKQNQILGYVDDGEVDGPSERDGRTILGSLSELPFLIQCHNIHSVYITLPMSARDRKARALMDKLSHCTASVYFVPDLLVASGSRQHFDTVGGLPVLAVRQSPLFGLGGAVKRIIDVLVSGSALFVLSPVLAAVAAGVRLSSPGPAIFKQRRYGLYGQEITIYKFRSMRVTEDGSSEYKQVMRNDSRVSRFGAFIRRTSLDELPQLYNVLQGSLSLVGPRPHVIAVNETYRHLIPNYMIRHNMKPGITGWAQINGYRGGDDLESMRGRIRCDLEYLRNWSVGLDLRILWRTAVRVWKDAHAY